MDAISECKDKARNIWKNKLNYAEFLKNKRVAIVGPSKSSIGSDLGSVVDSYDVVVRLLPSSGNIQETIDKNYKDVGSKTDILYSNFDQLLLTSENISNFKSQGVRFVNCTRPISELGTIWLHSKNLFDKMGMSYCPVKPEKYYNWSSTIKCSPHKGFCTILDIMSYEVKEIYVIGFSFYKDAATSDWANLNGWGYKKYLQDVEQVERDAEKVVEYYDKEKTYININEWTQESVHNNEKEFLFFKHEILNKDKRVKIAESLEHFFVKEGK